MKTKRFLLIGIILSFCLVAGTFANAEKTVGSPVISICDTLTSPSTGPAFGIHQGICFMGHMYENNVYDNRMMLNVIRAYWTGQAWGLTGKWGGTALEGYVVYAVARTAIKYRNQVNSYPFTKMYLECMLDDFAARDRTTFDANLYHGDLNDEWNSQSEDFMGFALGYAAVDAWYMNDAHRQDVKDAIETAFSIQNYPDPMNNIPRTLEYGINKDPGIISFPAKIITPGLNYAVMMRNHSAYSPVYAMVIIKHLCDINHIYRLTGLDELSINDPGMPNLSLNLPRLYNWLVSKIHTNLNGDVVFRNACWAHDNTYWPCDDSQVDPRAPGHYPLGEFLPDFGITNHLDYFGPPCSWSGPGTYVQEPHNYYYNCVFGIYDTNPEPILEVQYQSGSGNGPTNCTGQNYNGYRVHFVFDPSLGLFEERPGNGCGNTEKNNPTFVVLRVFPNGHNITYARVRDTWSDDWFICQPIHLQWINNSEPVTINTDPEQSPNCVLNGVPRYKNIGDTGYYKVYLRDSYGQVFQYRLSFKLIGNVYNEG